MLPEQKKREWLEKTGNPAALKLLEAGLTKNANQSIGQLSKEENIMENKTEEVVTEPKVKETPIVENAVVEPVIVKEEVPVAEVPVVENTTVEPVAEDLVTSLEPVISAIEAMNNRLQALEKSMGEVLTKSATTAQQLLPAAAKVPSAILKDRLSFVNVETFMSESSDTLVKSKPAENTVVLDNKSEAESLFSGFLSGN